MTTLDERLVATERAEPPRSLVQQLASAYAERLSCLRCDASAAELAENAELIAGLEARYRAERAQVQPPVQAAGAPTSIALRRRTDVARSALRLDPTVYLG